MTDARMPYSATDPDSADLSAHVGVDLSLGSEDWWRLEGLLDCSVGRFLKELQSMGIRLVRDGAPVAGEAERADE